MKKLVLFASLIAICSTSFAQKYDTIHLQKQPTKKAANVRYPLKLKLVNTSDYFLRIEFLTHNRRFTIAPNKSTPKPIHTDTLYKNERITIYYATSLNGLDDPTCLKYTQTYSNHGGNKTVGDFLVYLNFKADDPKNLWHLTLEPSSTTLGSTYVK